MLILTRFKWENSHTIYIIAKLNNHKQWLKFQLFSTVMAQVKNSECRKKDTLLRKFSFSLGNQTTDTKSLLS